MPTIDVTVVSQHTKYVVAGLYVLGHFMHGEEEHAEPVAHCPTLESAVLVCAALNEWLQNHAR